MVRGAGANDAAGVPDPTSPPPQCVLLPSALPFRHLRPIALRIMAGTHYSTAADKAGWRWGKAERKLLTRIEGD